MLEVGADPPASADGVTGRTSLDEQCLARRDRGLRNDAGGVEPNLLRCQVATPRVHVADGHRQYLEITKGGIVRPFAGAVVADQDFVAVLAEAAAALAELVADEADILDPAGNETPPRSHTECFGMGLEALGRIPLRIDGDRQEENIAPDEVAQCLLSLRQASSDERANILAGRIDETDDDDLLMDQVIVEIQLLAVLIDHRHVGKIVAPPTCGMAGRHQRRADDGRQQ